MPAKLPLRHVFQPRPSTICGPCCVAMVLGISVPEAITLVGINGGTRAIDLRQAFLKRGVFMGEAVRLKPRSTPDLPELAILKEHWRPSIDHPSTRKKPSHWVVWWSGFIYCPSVGIYTVEDNGGWEQWTDNKRLDGWFTSYYPLRDDHEQ